MKQILLIVLLVNVSLQNLIIQTKQRCLISIFEEFSRSLSQFLKSQPIYGHFIYGLSNGELEAQISEVNEASVSSADLKYVHGNYELQIDGVGLHLSGNWKHNSIMLGKIRTEKFEINMTNVSFTIGKFIPKNCDGVLFIEPDLECSMQSDSFSYKIEKSQEFTNEFVYFFRSIIDGTDIADLFCKHIVAAVDTYLRDKIDQLSLSHSLSTGSILDNSLLTNPVVQGSGDLITYHRGTLKKYDIQKLPLMPNTSSSFYLTYFLSKDLIEEVIVDFYTPSIYNQTFRDESNNTLHVTAASLPTISIINNTIKVLAFHHFSAEENGTKVLEDTHHVVLVLKPFYKEDFRIAFRLLRNTNFDFLKANLHQSYGRQLLEKLHNFVESLVIPLPSVQSLYLTSGTIKTTRSFLVLGANYDSLDGMNVEI